MLAKKATWERLGNQKHHEWGVVSHNTITHAEIWYCPLCKRYAKNAEGLYYIGKVAALQEIKSSNNGV